MVSSRLGRSTSQLILQTAWATMSQDGGQTSVLGAPSNDRGSSLVLAETQGLRRPWG